MTDNGHDVASALKRIQGEIRDAETRFNRALGSVQLLAVSKTKPVEDIRVALAAGQRAFGENYVDEAVAKVEALSDENIEWHYIGGIQSNKTRLLACHFDWVHGVDREKIARRLSEQRPENLPPQNICLQVNIDDESSKSGVSPADLPALAEAVAELPGITLRGLMVIPAPQTDFDQQRTSLSRVRKLFEALRSKHPQIDTLSMGMSGDMQAAIAEGSTMVRIGTAIFGARPSKAKS